MFSMKKTMYFRDSRNNLIKGEKEILLTSKKLLQSQDNEEDCYKTTTVLKPADNARKSETGIYSFYVDDDGNAYDVICSRFTKEIIPFEALTYRVLYILMTGLPDEGKTTNILQYIDDIPNILSRSSYHGYDTILQDYQYPEEFQNNMKRYEGREKPKPTDVRRISQTVPVLWEYKNRSTVIAFNETPGEATFEVQNEEWWSSDAIFFFMDASLENSRQILHRIDNMRGCPQVDRHIPVYVILTKADRAPVLLSRIPNSLKTVRGKLVMDENLDGFDWEKQKKTEAIIKDYLRDEAPRILNKLSGFDCHFFLVGNYMKDISGDEFPDENSRYRIETPLLCFMAEYGLFPAAEAKEEVNTEADEGEDEEEVKTEAAAKGISKLRSIKNTFLEMLKEDF